MVFAEGLNYTTPLQSPETAYIWDVGGQAITSGNFNTTISTDTNSVDLFHDNVLGANKNFYDAEFMRQRRRMQLAGWQWTRALPLPFLTLD